MALVGVEDPVRRVREPDRAVAGDDEVVGGVETDTVDRVHQEGGGQIGVQLFDAAAAMRALVDASIAGERTTVGELRVGDCDVELGLSRTPRQHAVPGDVADEQPVADPCRSLQPGRARRQSFRGVVGPELLPSDSHRSSWPDVSGPRYSSA